MSRPVSAARAHPKPLPSACCYPLSLFPQPPPARLRCPIDGGVLRDAVRSRVCGHVFGLQCAIYHSIEHEACIVCGAALDASDVQPVDAIRSEVSALRVHCAEGYDRCRWIGTVAEAAAHLNGPHCAVQRIDCPFCEKKGFEVGAAFEGHKAVCDECVVICPQCCDDMPRKALASHVLVCTADVIEPLRRQRENLSCPTTPLAKKEAFGSGQASSDAAVDVPSPLPTRPRHEEIDREDDDDTGVNLTSATVATPHHDATTRIAQGGNPARPLSPLDPTNIDTTMLPTGSAAAPYGTAVDDEFSPLPPHRAAPVQQPQKQAQPCANCPPAACIGTDASDALPRAPCPLRLMGCNAQHTAPELSMPTVMQQHLHVLADAFMSLQTAHAALVAKHDALAAVVEHQKKTIKMLEVRGAFHAGKLNVAAKPSTEGLVESPRTAAPSATTSSSSSVKTPQRASGGTKPTRDGAATAAAGRSASSPAAPDRSRADTSVGGVTAVPLFTPSVPSKKKPSTTLSSATAARRPPPAAPCAPAPDGAAAAAPAKSATS